MKRMAILQIGAAAAVFFAAGAALRAQGRPRLRPPKPPSKKGPPGSKKPTPGKDGQATYPPANIQELMKLYEARQYHSLQGSLPYRMLRPVGYTARRPYPMVVCLHGVPGRGQENSLQLTATYPARVLARAEMRQKYPCFVLAPQSRTWWGDRPYGAPPGGKPSGRDYPAMTLLLECIAALQDVFSIDSNRVYLTGHGMGAFGAFNALATDANTFAAAAVVSGGGDPNSASDFYWTPLWVFAGEKSRIRHYSETMVQAVRKFGAAPKYTVVPGGATRCWAPVYEGPALWDWLFAQRRRPKPALPTTWPATMPTTAPSLLPVPVPPPKTD